MRKGDLVSVMAEQLDLTKDKATQAVEVMIEAITGALVSNEDVNLIGFGAFKRRHRNARTAKNPQTGDPMEIPPCETVAFKPGKKLKERVNL